MMTKLNLFLDKLYQKKKSCLGTQIILRDDMAETKTEEFGEHFIV